MRIVYVSYEYPPQFGGGIGTYVHAMARTLAARGHAVTVLTVGDGPFPRRTIEDGVTLIRLPLPRPAGDGPVALLRQWQERADAVAELLHKLVRGGRVDLIEFCDYRGEGATFLGTTTPAQRPVCVTRLHTPMSVLHKYNPGQARYAVLEEFEHQALRLSDRIVSPSRALAEEMRGPLGADLPIDLSPHPVDPAFLAHGAQPPPAEGNECLYVGRYEERKGVETLARAAGRYLTACPDARLVMIGGDTVKGPQQPSVRRIVEDLIDPSVRDCVELLDRLPRDTLLERYRAARLCVFPSHFENFPNTCLEAMALGKCIIGTTNSGMAEMLADGDSGVIVPSGDAERLADALIRVHNMSVEDRRRMGVAARRRVETCYHPDVIAAALEQQYAAYIDAHAFRPAAAVRLAEPPPVAVVIPCYNHGRYLPEALASVRAQTYPHIECLVVDDGSTDAETRALLTQVEQAGTRVLRQSNQGLSVARNAGVRATSAPYFVPLDADDKLAPEFISTLLPPLIDDSTLGYCYSHAQCFGANNDLWPCAPYDPRKLLVENLSVATAVVRRTAFDEVGGYSPDMVHGFEDWDFWLALLAAGYGGHCVPAPLFLYRKHAAGSMLSATQKRRPAMVRQMIAHHRALFAAALEVSLADKDALFFDAHVQAGQMRDALVRTGRTADVRTDDEVYQRLLAQAELDYLENSRFWRLARRFAAAPAVTGTDPRARLARLKASRAYRLIQAFKRTAAYRWYARRKYGPDYERPPAAG